MSELRAVGVEADHQCIRLTLDDGRVISMPLEWHPRLLHATDTERKNCDVFGNGTAIEWPDLDEHISVEGLLAGRLRGESATPLERWFASRNQTKWAR